MTKHLLIWMEYDLPNLRSEIGASSFNDDLGGKRLLYEGAEELNIGWIVNTEVFKD